MTWNSIMGLISSIALLLPIIVILALRLAGYRSFPALLIYYIIIFTYNLLTEGYINVSDNVIRYSGLSNNLLDAPLILFFLTYFSTNTRFTKRMQGVILLFILFEAAILLLRGFNVGSLTIIIGPGLLIVFAFCMHFFIRQTKIAVMHGKATGKALIISSLLFAYGCYGIIYLMYYIFKTKDVANTFLIYFLVTTFSSLLMCAGVFIERKRVQKLAELKITRKELSIIYKEAKTAVPLQTVVIKKEKFS